MPQIYSTNMVSIVFHSFIYMDVSDMVCRIDLWHKLSPPFASYMHSVHTRISQKFFTA
jgi:hypothetical protein